MKQRLVADHRALDTLFEKLLDDIHGGDPSTCQASWGLFEKALIDHIDAEEVYLLRHLLADMGVRLELHAVKEENVKRLVVALRTHGAREEAVLYQSADELAPDMGEALASKLSAYRARH